MHEMAHSRCVRLGDVLDELADEFVIAHAEFCIVER